MASKKTYSDAEKAAFYKEKYFAAIKGGGKSSKGYSRASRNDESDRPKHSGCTAGRCDRIDPKDAKKEKKISDVPYVRGWKYDKQNGMRSFFASSYSKTKRVKSGEGVEWDNWMVKVSPKGAEPFIVSGLYNHQTKKVIIPDLQYVMNPKAPNGGYVGPYYQQKKRK